MTLLFLHPVGLDIGAAGFTGLPDVVSATLPGHGGRRRSRSGLSLEDMADEVAGWTDGPLDVVGASLGGMVALHLALAHPRRVRSMVLACTTASGDAEVLAARAAETEARGAAGMLASTLERWFTPEYLARSPEPAPLAYARERLLAADPGALADTWRAIGGHDVSGRLAEIAVPVTCVAGTRDLSTPSQVMRRLAAELPRARLVELEAPHMAFLECPAEFAAAVTEHLSWKEEDS